MTFHGVGMDFFLELYILRNLALRENKMNNKVTVSTQNPHMQKLAHLGFYFHFFAINDNNFYSPFAYTCT